jgi:hypothetical protein
VREQVDQLPPRGDHVCILTHNHRFEPVTTAAVAAVRCSVT